MRSRGLGTDDEESTFVDSKHTSIFGLLRAREVRIRGRGGATGSTTMVCRGHVLVFRACVVAHICVAVRCGAVRCGVW